MTDFENICLIVTLGLITNVINHFNVDFIIPITLVDENMKRAICRDAILNKKFWFKKNYLRDKNNFFNSNLHSSDFLKSMMNENDEQKQKIEDIYEELYVHEIFNGKPEINFIGLLTLIRKFMDIQNYK
jgi:glutamate--cysteine ligase catalytic subunit